MTARFRIRTSQGQELSFASREVFEEFVRSGDLAPDDLVYDGETGEWAPSRTHPIVLEIEYAEEDDDAQAASPAGPTLREGGAAGTPPTSDAPDEEIDPNLGPVTDLDALGNMGLELAPPADGMSAQEEQAAFLKKLESERAMERDFGSSSPARSIGDIRMDDTSTYADLARREPEPEERPPPPPPTPRAKPRPKPRPRRSAAAKRGKKKKGSLLPKIAAVVVLVAVAGAGVYFGRDLVGREGPPGPDPVDSLVVQPERPPERDPDPPPPPTPTIASTESAVRERARERFVTSTQALIDGLQPIPDVWLTGEYFVLPSDYPEVRAVWQRYRSAIRDIHAGDVDRYRRAYVAALADAGVVPDSTQPGARVTTAVGAFESTVAEVAAHWDRVENLAQAAVQSHDALIGAEGLILYDASGSTGRPEGIGRGTSGRNSDAQLLLDQVVDLLGSALVADGFGPREGASVREWAWGGFLDATTRD